MPITILSKTFSDEFNTGTTTTLDNANVSDNWTATINIEFKNIIDADSDGTFIWEAYSSNNVLGVPQGLQVFEANNDLSNFYWDNFLELQLPTFAGSDFWISDFHPSLNGLYTIRDVLNIGGKFVIVCTDLFNDTKSSNSGEFALNEDLTAANIDYRVSGTSNDADYSPTIEINGNTPANFSSTAANLDASSATVVNVPFKFNGAYQTGGLTISGVSYVNNIQKFELVHTFEVAPISIYNSGNSRLPSNFNSSGDSKYSNLFDGLGGKISMNGFLSNQVAGGVNVNLDIPYSSGDNDIRTFGNRYTGGSTDYSVSNLAIVRTSDSYSTNLPIVEEKFTVTFNVDNTADSPFSDGNTLVKVGIENLPETITNLEDYEQQYLSDYALELLGAGAGTGNATGDALSISAYQATWVSNSQIAITFDVDFTANAQTQIQLNSSPYFSIYVQTQNHTLDYTNSDRVVLSVFSNDGIQRVLPDPITVNSTKFLTAPFTLESDAKVAADLSGFPVQLLTSITSFSADWTNRTNLRIDKITQSLVLKNTSTLEEIPLEETVIPVNTFKLISGEYPNANYSVQKGFKIPATEVRNLIEFSNVSDVSSVRTFDVSFPFFVRWEEYTELIMNAIPSTILDVAEPFDGKNYDLYRIDAIANWELSFRLNFECNEDGTDFSQTFDYVIPTNTYDTHPEISARSIKTYELDGTTLQPTIVASGLQVIDSDLDTVLEVVNTVSPQPTTIADFEYEFYIEAFEDGSPTKIQRISSINSLLASSWLGDNGVGDGLILKTIDGSGNPVGTCLINVNNLVEYDKYRIYSTYYTTSIIQMFTFQTESNVPTDTFDPSLVTIGGELPTWELIGGYRETATTSLNIAARTGLSGVPTSLVASELNGVCQNVEMTFSTNDPSNLIQLIFDSISLCDTIDISLLTGLTHIYLYNNTSLSGIVNATTSTVITRYWAYSCGLTGTLDMSGLTGLGGDVKLYVNYGVTSIKNPDSSQVFTNYDCSFMGIVGNLDMSGLTGLGGSFNCAINPTLTSIKNPTNTALITTYQCRSCNITGVLNISMMNLSGSIILWSNILMTGVSNPTTSAIISTYTVYNCGLTGTLDMSGLTGLSGTFQVFGNSGLTSITNPITSGVFDSYSASNCDIGYIDFTSMANLTDVNNSNISLENNNMTATEVDDILVDLANISSDGYTSRIIKMDGSNAAPSPTGEAAIDTLRAFTNPFTVTVTGGY